MSNVSILCRNNDVAIELTRLANDVTGEMLPAADRARQARTG